MALSPVVSASDGARIEVNDLVKNPMVIPRRIIQLSSNQFIGDSLFRSAGSNPGSVRYDESSPLFMNEDAAVKSEFGEYKVGTSSEGVPSIAVSVNKGMSIIISEMMRRRNQMDRVNQQITQVTNTLIRTWDKAVRNLVLDTSKLPTVASSGKWANSSTDVRGDILEAVETVTDAVFDGQDDNYLDFDPDTMVCSRTVANQIIGNNNFNSVYVGNIADQNVKYNMTLPNQIGGLTVMISRSFPNDKVWVGERGTVGFISDERSMRATSLYEDQKTETWRSDVSRITAMGMDQPKAGCIITGVDQA